MTCRGASAETGSTGLRLVATLLVTLLVLLPAACGSAERGDDEAPVPGLEATDSSTSNLGRPARTMATAQLDQLAVNEEYGIRAFFPRGAAVCEARSWQHPFGFYTFLGEQRACGHALAQREAWAEHRRTRAAKFAAKAAEIEQRAQASPAGGESSDGAARARSGEDSA